MSAVQAICIMFVISLLVIGGWFYSVHKHLFEIEKKIDELIK